MSAIADELPKVFVIGAAKAGTTSLARWLDDHPAVTVAQGKELNFFSYDRVWELGLEWYVNQFVGGRTAIRCDASPSYLPSRDAPGRMRAHVPDAKLIALLRDPVQRAYVHYWWLRSWGAEQRQFHEVVRNELIDGLTPMGCVDSSRYATHLSRFAEHFPPEQLLIVDFLALRDRPREMFREVCRFLGITEVVPESVGTAFNVSTDVRSRRLWAWLGRKPGRRSWREHPRGLDRLLLRPPERPPMDSADRRILEDYFGPYDEELRTIWGRNVLPWDAAANNR